MLLALAGLSISTAQAAEPATLTLACGGTVIVSTSMPGKPTINEAPEPVSVGIILNLTDRAVSGFKSLVTIDSIEDAHIQFSGSNESGLRISGSIDRVTDETEIHLNGGEQGIGRKKLPIIAEMQADAARCLLRNAQQLFAT
jgi:hypothetical protein